MRRSSLSLWTAVLCAALALVCIAAGRAGSGVTLLAIGIGWSITALLQRRKSAPEYDPYPRQRLFMRISRIILFWS